MIRSRLANPITTATAASGASYFATVVQQLVYARTLGIDPATDALAAAMGWSLALTGVVGTTFTAILVPAYARVRARGGDPKPLADASFTLVVLVALALAAGTVLASEQLARYLLPGGEGSSVRLLQTLLVLSAPQVVSWTAVIIIMAIGQARSRYALVGYTGAIPSVIVIGALLTTASVQAVPVAYAIGFGLQGAAILAALGRDAWPGVSRRLGPVQPLLRHLVPVGFGFFLINASMIFLRAVISLGTPGDVSTFDYAYRLTTSVETLAMSGLVAVALTVWSEDHEIGADRLNVKRTLAGAFVYSLGLATAVVAFGGVVVKLLYGGGSFSTADAGAVTTSLQLIAPAMAARMIHMVAIRSIQARHASVEVSIVGIAALVGVGAGALLGSPHGYEAVLIGYDAGWAIAALVTVVLALRVTPGRSPLPTATSSDWV